MKWKTGRRFILALSLSGLFGICPKPLAAKDFSGIPALLPVPEKVVPLGGFFPIDENLTVGFRDRTSPRAFKGAARFMGRLAGRTGLFLKQDYLASQETEGTPGILYSFERFGKLEPGEAESYSLEIGPEGAVIQAETDIGILRGFETLLQLLTTNARGYGFPCVRIQDRPRFVWRGLLIDSGRHFHPVDVIKRNLDAMAAVKLNVFHWHLTEDQGFRVESRVFPMLHRLGSDGMYYTQEQIEEVVEYAADRGVRVMPEFDIPGHSTSWFVGYPELSSGPGPFSIERRFGVFGPVFNPASQHVFSFLGRFFKEMADLFPDPFLHIGGDEVEGKQWDANQDIRAFKKKKNLADNSALQAYFNARILKILTGIGKKMVGWDEIFQPGLPGDTVIQSWRGPEALVESARKGYRTILSNGYYIDLCQPAEDHYRNDPLPQDTPLTEDEQRLILGGEATMWSELVSSETIDSRIWPRTAAIAERLWSPRSVDNVEDMYRRLGIISLALEELGLTHIKNPDMMLRRLACSSAIQPLRVLADVTEPLKRYRRHSQGVTYTSLSPLTRFVDACAPESLQGREFRAAAIRFSETRILADAVELKKMLALWKGNHPRILGMIADSPALREIEELSYSLAAASEAGLEAVDILLTGFKAPSDWLEKKEKILEEAGKPRAHAELAVLAGIRALVEGASGSGKSN